MESIKTILKKLLYFGFRYYCPLCSSKLRAFKSFGRAERTNALCPVCGALERHRVIWLLLKRKTNLLDAKSKILLHIAPEKCLSKLFERIENLEHITADLNDPNVKLKMDITDISFPDNSFDIILCSHVLEHVEDDRKALSEFHRTLKPGGWALIVVPITSEKTFEDKSVTDPEKRTELFGQHDHLRRYGKDFIDRLSEAGFIVKTYCARDILDENEITKTGLAGSKILNCPLYLCTKK